MLILRRKVGEKIVIGEGITVVVSRVSGGRVTLGIEAPSDVHIVRGELEAFGDKGAKESPRAPVLVPHEPHVDLASRSLSDFGARLPR